MHFYDAAANYGVRYRHIALFRGDAATEGPADGTCHRAIPASVSAGRRSAQIKCAKNEARVNLGLGVDEEK